MARRPEGPLRSGWTTGACAAAAAKSAAAALESGAFLDPVSITLPKGEQPAFPLALREQGEGWARAGVIKDAGDDPDVTHGALIVATLRPAPALQFAAGEGVGMVTKPGLPIPPGEPAINPAPRALIEAMLREIAGHARFAVEISVPGGAALAEKTWNPRLGIRGGISILGTTGIVRPFSCAAWIASIHRGIDVARASGLAHALAATGSTSEAAALRLYDLPLEARLDMGDFVGGLLKYLRRHPIPRLTIAGGVAKMTKLAQGATDLHSGRSQVDFADLAQRLERLGGTPDLARQANTAAEVFAAAAPALPEAIAADARASALAQLGNPATEVETLLVDRNGRIVGRAGFER
ncbi:MAG: cobalt-precorrin-5B (C(1))-methyltransferase [Pseudomonadota bacterium]